MALLMLLKQLNYMGYKTDIIYLKGGPLLAEFKKLGKVIAYSEKIWDRCFFKQYSLSIISTVVLYKCYEKVNSYLPTLWWVYEGPSFFNDTDLKNVFSKGKNIYTVSEMNRKSLLKFNKNIGILHLAFEDNFRKSLSFPSIPTFAVVGSIQYIKGQDVFVEAVNRLPLQIRNKARFMILGNVCSNSEKMRDELIRKGSHIEFINGISHDDMLQFYEKISCLVIPSREDTHPLVAFEAMMMGKPVIFSDNVGDQYLFNGKNGAKFSSGNSYQLSKILEHLILNKSQFYKMGQEARKSFLWHNNIKIIRNSLLEQINTCISHKPVTKEVSVYKKILFIEPNPCHGEVLPGMAQYFLDLNYHVDVFVSSWQISLSLSFIASSKLKIFLYNKPFFDKILTDLNLDDYNAIYFNSDNIYSKNDMAVTTYYSKLISNYKKPIFIMCHLGTSVFQGIKNIHCIYLCPKKRFFDYNFVNAHYFIKTKNKVKNKKTNFIVVGSLERKRKDFEALIKCVKHLLKNNITNFSVTVVTKSKNINIPNILQKYITLISDASYPQLFSLIFECDFILSLLNPKINEHKRYLIDASGTYQLVYGFNKPCLIPFKYMTYHTGFNRKNSLGYRRIDDLAMLMEKAIFMDSKAYNKMKKNLKKLSTRLYTRSFKNLQRLIK